MEDFEAVYGEYREMVYRFLLRLCANRNLAEELTQETFYRAMRQWARFRGACSVSTYLCAIAKRLYIDTLRRAKLPLALEPPPAQDVADTLIESDRHMTAQRVLHALGEPYREVFTLRTFCDLSHAQIGELFGKSESWARVTYFRARQMLAQSIKEAEKE